MTTFKKSLIIVSSSLLLVGSPVSCSSHRGAKFNYQYEYPYETGGSTQYPRATAQPNSSTGQHWLYDVIESLFGGGDIRRQAGAGSVVGAALAVLSVSNITKNP